MITENGLKKALKSIGWEIRGCDENDKEGSTMSIENEQWKGYKL